MTDRTTVPAPTSERAGEQATWQVKVKVAKEAQEAGKALRAGRPKVFRERRLTRNR